MHNSFQGPAAEKYCRALPLALNSRQQRHMKHFFSGQTIENMTLQTQSDKLIAKGTHYSKPLTWDASMGTESQSYSLPILPLQNVVIFPTSLY